MKKLALVAAVAAAAAFPTTALAGTFSGVVVGKGGGTLAVAAKGGSVRTVPSRAHLRLGARVHVNGTAVRSFGVASRAHVRGVVLRRVGRTTFLAAGRSLLALRAPSAPASGAIVDANVAIGGGVLTQRSLVVVGRDERVTIQALVMAVGPGTITLAVNGRQLTLHLPAGIQLPASLVGQSVTLTVKVEDENEVEIEPNDDNDDGDHHGGDDGDHDGHGGEGHG